ncbi:MAG: phenylacetate--CoA ligase family protein [Anaerolineae bacterium]|nr:phenylacetate--CoA ligase family protein [Anaerolineae bacterium]
MEVEIVTLLTPLEPWIARKIGGADAPLTRSRLEAYQVERICDTLRRCQRSPFYRAHLAGLPGEISGLDELRAFPFTTAEDIRREALRFLCVSQSDIHRVVTLDTSGTTGPPKRLYFTRADQELTIDFFRVGMSTFTDPGDRVLILLPCERPGSVGDLLAVALARLGAEGIRYGVVRDAAEALRVLRRERANGVVGIPVQVLALVRSEPPGGFPALQLKSVLLTTDHVPQAIVRAVERAWGCVVYNHYGMTEMGLGGGVECAARRGYHLREADLYVEIIDPATGAPAAEGEAGEVVFTTLTREGMPLVRYRTGDISRFIPGACPCGTVLKTLERVRYRLDGIVHVNKDHDLTMAHLDEALFSVEGVLDFDATWSAGRDGGALSLCVQVVENAGMLPALEAALRTIPALRGQAVDIRLRAQTHSLPAPAKRTIR